MIVSAALLFPGLALAQPILGVSGACPGPVDINITGATANGNVGIASADTTGNAVIPVGNCAGAPLGLSQAGLTLRATRVADALGNVTVSPTLPAFACSYSIVAVDLGSCTVSNVVNSFTNAGAYAATFAPEASGGTGVVLGDDDTSGLLPIGFSFPHFGTRYTDFNISSNGFIGFDAVLDNGCCQGDFIPGVGTPNNIVAYAWTDIDPTAGGSISYETRGIAPDRRLVVSFDGLSYFGNYGANVTSQVILRELTGTAEVHTTQQDSGEIVTQGIENALGNDAHTLPGRNNADFGLTNDGSMYVSN